MHRIKPEEDRRKLNVTTILQEVDVPTVLFSLLILMAVGRLASAGYLAGAGAYWLQTQFLF
jgi:hypothetical protein